MPCRFFTRRSLVLSVLIEPALRIRRGGYCEHKLKKDEGSGWFSFEAEGPYRTGKKITFGSIK
jgi:hypothetical protein